MKLFIVLIISFFITVGYSKTLIIGTTPDNPPFASLADNKNNFYGFEIDIMTDVCARIKSKCQFQAITVSDVVKLFRDDKVDLAIATIIAPPATETGATGFIFSAPYLTSSAQFMVRTPSNIHTLQNIRNKKVGVRLGSFYGGILFKDYILAMYNQQLTIVLYLNICDLIDALQNKEVEAVFTNSQGMQYWYINNKQQFRLVGDPFPIGNGYTIMGKKGDEHLITQISHALYAMEQDGTYAKLYDRYFTLK